MAGWEIFIIGAVREPPAVSSMKPLSSLMDNMKYNPDIHHRHSIRLKGYERIIRNESELNRIREYIEENPLHWETDENFNN